MHGSQMKFHIMKRSMSLFSKFPYLKNFLACTPASSNISNVWKLVAKKNVKPGGCQVKLHTVKALHLDSKKLQKKQSGVSNEISYARRISQCPLSPDNFWNKFCHFSHNYLFFLISIFGKGLQKPEPNL